MPEDKAGLKRAWLQYTPDAWEKMGETARRVSLSVLKSFSMDDLQQMLDEGNMHDFYRWYVKMEISDRISKEERRAHREWKKRRSENLPVNQLLSLYLNKKSRMVREARRQMQQRFLYLAADEQVEIMRIMLLGSKAERSWCYRMLRDWWSDRVAERLMDVWKLYHEEECGWALTRHLDADELLSQYDELSYPSNYYLLCRRLLETGDFKVDLELLYEGGNLDFFSRVVEKMKSGVNQTDAQLMLNKFLIHSIRITRKNLLLALSDPARFHLGNDPSVLFDPSAENLLKDRIMPALIRMGHLRLVWDFMLMVLNVRDDFMREFGNEIAQTWQSADPMSNAIVDAKKSLFNRYLYRWQELLSDDFAQDLEDLSFPESESVSRKEYVPILKDSDFVKDSGDLTSDNRSLGFPYPDESDICPF